MTSGATFAQWQANFETSDRGKNALHQMQESLEGYDGNRYHTLEKEVLLACFKAFSYQQSYGRTSQEHRRQQREDQRWAASVCTSATRLLSLTSDHQARAFNALRAGLASIPDARQRTHQQSLAPLISSLQALVQGLSTPPNARNAEKASRQFGCLRYPLNTSASPAPFNAALNGLAFQLEYIFRVWTQKEKAAKTRFRYLYRIRSMDKLAPVTMHSARTGRPCYKIIAAFVNATLYGNGSKQYTANCIKTRLHKLSRAYPGIEYIGWTA